MELPIHADWGDFGVVFTLIDVANVLTPKRTISAETRCLSHKKRKNRSTYGSILAQDRDSRKMFGQDSQKSQIGKISPIWGEAMYRMKPTFACNILPDVCKVTK